MACDFCRVTPVDPCPVCGPAIHAGNTRIRKLPKALRNAIANAAPKPRPVPHVMDAHGFRPVGAPSVAVSGWAPGGTLGSRSTAARLADAEREAALRAAPTPGPNSRARYTPPPAAPKAPPTNPIPPVPIASLKPAQPARMGILTPITPEDWRAAERFVRGVLWAKRLPSTVDSVATVVTHRDEEATLPPISRGDFRGLWVAVEAGHLSEAAAIELAASWRVGVTP